MSDDGFSIDDGQVYYEHHYVGRSLLEGVDAATFQTCFDPSVPDETQQRRYAGTDKASAWFMNKRIDDADVESFRFFHGGQCRWACDRLRVYSLYVSARPKVKVARSKAPETLRFLDEPIGAYMRLYALTDDRVFYYGRWVRGADPQTFRSMPADRFGLEEPRARSGVYRDDKFAYYQGRKLAGIEPKDLVIFQHPALGSRMYATDRAQAYVVNTTRDRERSVSGTGMTRLMPKDVRESPRLHQVREYLATRTDLDGYWFNRGPR